jgi:hypothetical protein
MTKFKSLYRKKYKDKYGGGQLFLVFLVYLKPLGPEVLRNLQIWRF